MVFLVSKLNSRRSVALVIFACCLGLGTSLYAQVPESETSSFSIAGRVVAKSKYGFEVTTVDNEKVTIAIDQDTDFALRMSRPQFIAGSGKVALDGPAQGEGQGKRIRMNLPEGKLYLLVQFRNKSHRIRVLSKSPWRLNNYLLSNQPIESVLPKNKETLLSGEIDLESFELKIDGKSYPVELGYRGATLGGRSIADLEPGKTVVVVSGVVAGEKKLAKTVLYKIR